MYKYEKSQTQFSFGIIIKYPLNPTSEHNHKIKERDKRHRSINPRKEKREIGSSDKFSSAVSDAYWTYISQPSNGTKTTLAKCI